jgi:hypothetical protein
VLSDIQASKLVRQPPRAAKIKAANCQSRSIIDINNIVRTSCETDDERIRERTHPGLTSRHRLWQWIEAASSACSQAQSVAGTTRVFEVAKALEDNSRANHPHENDM